MAFIKSLLRSSESTISIKFYNQRASLRLLGAVFILLVVLL